MGQLLKVGGEKNISAIVNILTAVASIGTSLYNNNNNNNDNINNK